MLAVTLLAVVRGWFALFPKVHVRSFWLKSILIFILVAVAGYAWYSEPVDNVSPPLRIAPVILALAVVYILTLPGGDLDETKRKSVIEMLDTLVIAGVTALVVITFFVRPFFIPSGSMEPTLQIQDMVLVDELAYRFWSPARDDVIVFHPPSVSEAEALQTTHPTVDGYPLRSQVKQLEGKDLIKRVVAVGGDTIEVREDVVYLNGRPLTEPFVKQADSEDYHHYPLANFGPTRIPPNCVFCMGDNRANSDDSRVWGPLPAGNIIGKAFFIFYPPTRIGRVR